MTLGAKLKRWFVRLGLVFSYFVSLAYFICK